MTFPWDYSSIAYSCIMGCQSNFSERGAVIKKKNKIPHPHTLPYTYTHAKGNCKIIEIIAFSDDGRSIPVHWSRWNSRSINSN